MIIVYFRPQGRIKSEHVSFSSTSCPYLCFLYHLRIFFILLSFFLHFLFLMCVWVGVSVCEACEWTWELAIQTKNKTKFIQNKQTTSIHGLLTCKICGKFSINFKIIYSIWILKYINRIIVYMYINMYIYICMQNL